LQGECRTPGTMDNWYHAIIDMVGQLGLSSFVMVDNLDYPVLSWWTTKNHLVWPEWTTGGRFTNILKEGFTPIFSATLSYGKSVSP